MFTMNQMALWPLILLSQNWRTTMIELLNLEGKVSNAEIAAKINEIITVLNESSAPRDRGPKAERTMTEDDARRVILGDLKDASHKAAAEELKLSYGQIYSARKGFTFKGIHAEIRKSEKATTN
jgi:hypothetical protein